MKNPQMQLIMKKQYILNIWKLHFEKHINIQFPHEDDLREFKADADNITEYILTITEQEVENSINRFTNRKAAGIDRITSELIKAGV